MAGSRAKIKAAQAQRARATRRRVIDAASALFVEHGYLSTTMADIARHAGVAVQTLYLSFGSKAAVLSAALDVAIVGDDEPVPVLERPWIDRFRSEPDGHRALRVFIQTATEITARTYPLWATMRAAATDPDVGQLLQQNSQRRYNTHAAVMAEVANKTPLAPGMTLARATQILYSILSQETYGLLVIEHHWTVEYWSSFATRTVTKEIFTTQPVIN